MRNMRRYLLVPLLNLLVCTPLFASQAVTERCSYKIQCSTEDRLVIEDQNTQCSSTAPDEISLQSGCLLVRANKPTTISTSVCRTMLANSAVVLMKVNETSVSVTNLGDYKRGSISVFMGNKVMSLEDTSQVVFTRGRPAMSDVFDLPKIGRRSVFSRNISGIGWITTAQVSLSDSLVREPLLVAARTRGNSHAEKVMVHQLIKLAAIVQIVFRQRGRFLQRAV